MKQRTLELKGGEKKQRCVEEEACDHAVKKRFAIAEELLPNPDTAAISGLKALMWTALGERSHCQKEQHKNESTFAAHTALCSAVANTVLNRALDVAAKRPSRL